MSDLDGMKIGRYHIFREVGRGGVATVYQARDLDTGKVVAVKVLAPYLVSEENIRIRFQREADVLETLEHPNIVPVLDHGEADGYVYLVLPYIDYGTLSDRMRSGPIRPQEGARYISQIASALEYAHNKGIVHRDIKPSNILITDEGETLLSDFGFIQMEDSPQSLTGSAIIGTPAFMAPEQIRGEDVTARSDQYALGVLLYQMSTGELPYDAETPMGVAIKHATDPLPRPRAVNPNLPDAVEAVIIKSLEKEPENRYDSVETFNDAFQDALVASIDPTTGGLRPGAVGEDPETAVLKLPIDKKNGIFSRRSSLAIILLLLLFACPVSVWALSDLGGGGLLNTSNNATETSMVVAMADSLSTENAEMMGTESIPGEINTAVAGTMTSLAPLLEAQDTDGTPIGELLTQTAVALETEVAINQATSGAEGAEASMTPSSIASPTRTLKPGEPSWTPEPPATKTRTPTATRTMTSSPTKTTTPSATPSVTPIPPTSTQDICGLIDFSGFATNGQELDWSISNSTGSSIRIDAIYLNWPEGNEKLKKIELAEHVIWDEEEDPPTVNITSGFHGNRQIGSGQSEYLSFFFDSNASSSGYSLEIGFNNGCSPQQSH